MDLPSRALSVRQPWAWAIIHAGKDVENRSKGFFGLKRFSSFLGAVAIHAAKGMTQDEYRDAAEFMAARGVRCPPPAELVRGGIIGDVSIAGIYANSRSQWWAGVPQFAMVIDQSPGMVRACDPIPSKGALGYFEWEPAGILEEPKRWMTQWDPQAHLRDFERVSI